MKLYNNTLVSPLGERSTAHSYLILARLPLPWWLGGVSNNKSICTGSNPVVETVNIFGEPECAPHYSYLSSVDR